jgi:hypothetical protein
VGAGAIGAGSRRVVELLLEVGVQNKESRSFNLLDHT